MAHEPRDPQNAPRSHDSAADADLRRRTSFLEQEIELLRAKVAESPRHMRILEDRLTEAQTRVATLNDRNERLADTLREARDQMVALKEEIDRLAQPPSGYGVFLDAFEDGTVDIFTAGRKLRVAVSPEVSVPDLQHGQEVMLNEAMNVVAARGFERAGDVVMLKEILEGGDRALVIGHTDEERVVYLSFLLLALFLTSLNRPAAEYLGGYKSVKKLSSVLSASLREGDVVAQYQTYRQGLPFYTKRRSVLVNEVGELEFGAERAADRKAFFLDDAAFLALWNSPARVFCVGRSDKLPLFREKFPGHRLLYRSDEGILIVNRL